MDINTFLADSRQDYMGYPSPIEGCVAYPRVGCWPPRLLDLFTALDMRIPNEISINYI